MYKPPSRSGRRHRKNGSRGTASENSSAVSWISSYVSSINTLLSFFGRESSVSTKPQSDLSIASAHRSLARSHTTDGQYKTDDSRLKSCEPFENGTTINIRIAWNENLKRQHPKSKGRVYVEGTTDRASFLFSYLMEAERQDDVNHQVRLDMIKKDLQEDTKRQIQQVDVRRAVLSAIRKLHFQRDPRKDDNSFESNPKLRIWSNGKWYRVEHRQVSHNDMPVAAIF